MPRSRSSAANIAAPGRAPRALWTRVVVGLAAGMAMLAGALLTPLWVAHAANNSVQGATKKEDGFESDAPSAILIEASSGSVLYEKNADQALPPSSMLKLMTVEVVFNEIQQGRIKLEDEYRVSQSAWRRGGAPSGGSTMFAAINSKIAVRDLLSGAIIQSGNDSCIILAEGIAGNEDNFTRLMSERARELGLPQATFGNSTGLPDPRNLMSVRELGTLARHIIATYPEFYKLFGEREFTWNKIRQFNRNPLLTSFNGADGLKTGYTKEGGYGVVASAMQSGTRLIAVVNGLETAGERAEAGEKLLKWGFRNFQTRPLFNAGQVLGYAKVFGGAHGSVDLVSTDPVAVMVAKEGNDKIIARIVYTGPVRAPIRKGQKLGTVRVWRNNNPALDMPLFANDNVPAGSMTGRAFDVVGEMTINLLRSGIGK